MPTTPFSNRSSLPDGDLGTLDAGEAVENPEIKSPLDEDNA